MLPPVNANNSTCAAVAVQFKYIVLKKTAIVRPRRFETVGIRTEFRGNASAEAAGTENFDACFDSDRINGQAIGKSPAGIDPDLPGLGNRIFQNNGLVTGIH
jgi:hypothetical protein